MKKFTLPVGIVLSLLVIAALVGAAWQPQPTAAVEPRTFASYEELVQYIEKIPDWLRSRVIYLISVMAAGDSDHRECQQNGCPPGSCSRNC